MRECEAVPNIQSDADEVCKTRKYSVNGIEKRRNKEKRKLDGLSDADQERGERRGDHKGADFGSLIRTGGAPYRKGRSRKPEHFELIAPGHSACGGIAMDEARDLAVH
jgi:hypothetical protein